MKWTKDFNIVLAHRGPWMGLWATITACEMALKGTDYAYSYVIVANGDKQLANDMKKGLEYLDHSGKLGQFVYHPAPMAPQNARQMGTTVSNGDLIFFFDNHCLVPHDYFERAIEQMKRPEIEMLHSTTMFHTGHRPMYSYVLNLEANFWTGGSHERPQDKKLPYRCAMGGHGGFVVKRQTWNEVGGYWTALSGYGGEEPYFDLKMWMLGKEVWIDPKLVHYHFAGDRGYARHYTDDFYRNMMAVANVIGGDEWLMKVYDSFSRSSKAKGKTMFELYIEACDLSRERAAQMAASRVRTLDETLAHFKAENIAH